jgi:hypothetical protein
MVRRRRLMWAPSRAVAAWIVLGLALTAWVAPVPVGPAAAQSTFSGNVKVNDDSTGSRSAPSVALHNGDIYVVWHDMRDGDFDIYFTKSVNAGLTFGPDIQVNDDVPGESANQLWPDIAVVAGAIFVVWEDWRGGDRAIYMSRSLNGGEAFSQDVKVDPSGTDDGRPAIASDPARGWILAAWSHADEEIRAARSLNGGPFSPPATVSDAPGIEKRYPDVAVGPNGSVHVAWADGRAGTIYGPFGPEPDFDIYAASSSDGLTWNSNYPVSDGPAETVQTFPTIAVDASGRVHAAWQDDSTGQRTIRYSRADDGVNFAPSVPVLPNPSYAPYNTADQQTPSLAWDEASQTVHVAWADDAGGNFNIRMASKTGDGDFHPAVRRAGGNRFLDAATPALNGLWDPAEAVLWDDGDGILDPGVLDGTGSPDEVVVPGAANLAEDLTGLVLTYNDQGGDGQWDRGVDDIVLDNVPVVYPQVESTKITAWDNTSGNFPSYLRWDSRDGDYVNYSVGPGEVMSVGWFYVDGAKDEGIHPENFGLKTGDPISNVTLELSYTAAAGFAGALLNYSFSLGANATVATLPSTGGVEVLRYFDLYAVGVDTVQKLRDLNVSLENADPANPVDLNRMTLRIHRGLPGKFDVYDTVLSGNGTSVQGAALGPLQDGDEVMFLDSNLNGRYDLGEPLVVTAQDTPPGGNLTSMDEVLPRLDGGLWVQFLTPFPLNDDSGDAAQFWPSVAAGGGVVAAAWQDMRSGGNDIYATTAAVDVRAPEVLEVSPADGAVGVSLATSILISFSEPIAPGTARVDLDPPVQVTESWDPQGEALTLRPASPLASNTTYTLTVAAAEDSAGNALDPPFTSTFTTAIAPALDHTPPSSLVAGEPLVLLVNASDDGGVEIMLARVTPPGGTVAKSYMLGLESGDATAGTWRVEVPLVPTPGSVEYAFTAIDSDGNVAVSPVSGSYRVPIVDPVPPTLAHQPLKEAVGGSTVVIRATATDASGVVRVTLRMRPPGATEFGAPVVLHPTDGEYAVTLRVPEEEGILHYYLEAEDAFGNVATFPAEGPENPLPVRVSAPPPIGLWAAAALLASLIVLAIMAIRFWVRPGEEADRVRANRARIEKVEAAYAEGRISREVYEANMDRLAGPALDDG